MLYYLKVINRVVVAAALLISTSASGQNTKTAFIEDLDFVFSALKSSASYKTQKDRQDHVARKYEELKAQASGMTIFERYRKLYEMVDQIEDYHNDIYGNSESFSFNDLQNEQFLEKIRNSPDYDFYPKTNMDLDSLEMDLLKRKVSDYEGIYFYRNYFKIGIARTSDSVLTGFVLDTRIPSWQRGEIILYLQKKSGDRFRIFSGRFVDKKLFSALDYFSNGEFRALGWQKQVPDLDYYNVGFPDQKYLFKKLNDDFDYLKLGSFSSSAESLRNAKKFAEEISGKFKKQNLIVDLRNNGGGGDKNSTQFYKMLRTFKGNIYVLVNFHTVSNAEQFTVKLKSLKNTKILGDNTRGMLAYGRNYPEDKVAPSKKFRIYFTDMKDNWERYLPYEGNGIDPDIRLASDQDWIGQVLDKYAL